MDASPLHLQGYGPRPYTADTFRDLPIGSLLTLVDLSDPSNPAVVDTAEIGNRLDGLSLSPDGSMVAVALHPTDGRGIAFVELNEGEIGDVSYANIAAITESQRISHMEWHPSKDFLVIHTVDQAVVHFAQVTRLASGVTLTPWGNPVSKSKYPFMGRFTPDGAHYLTANLFWGGDVPGIWTEAVDGDVMSIRFDASGRCVAAVNYDQIPGGAEGGSIDFWRVVEEDAPKLVQTRTSVVVPHGPHSTQQVK